MQDKIYVTTLDYFLRRIKLFGLVKGLSGLTIWMFAYEELGLITCKERFEIEERIRSELLSQFHLKEGVSNAG